MYWTLFLLGVSVLTTSSALIAAGDYYDEVFGETQVLFLAPLAISISSPFVQTLIVFLQSYFTYTSRIFFCYTVNGILALMLPIVISMDTSLGYNFLIMTLIVVGVSNAILKATILSLAAMFPPEYTHAVLMGKGMSSIIVAAARILIKLYFTGGRADTQRGALLFFGLATALSFASVICFRLTRRTFFSRYYFPSYRLRRAGVVVNDELLAEGDAHVCCTVCGKVPETLGDKLKLTSRKTGEEKDALLLSDDSVADHVANEYGTLDSNAIDENHDLYPPGHDSALSLNSSPVNINSGDVASVSTAKGAASDAVSDAIDRGLNHEAAHVSKTAVFKKIMYELWLIFAMFTVTFLAFPGLAQSTPPSWSLNKGWTNVIILAVFGVADFTGRCLNVNWLMRVISIRACAVHIYLRLFVYAGFVYSVYFEHLNTIIILVLTVLMAFSNGYLCVLVANYPYPRVSANEKATAGALVSTTIVAGVLAGSLTALLIDAIAKKHS